MNLPFAFSTVLGRTMLALGMGGLGVLALIYRDFALNWQPVPESVPARAELAMINGAAMLAAAVAMMVPRTRVYGAAALALYLAFWSFGLHGPRLLAGVEAAWLGATEALAMAAGAWIVAAAATSRKGWLLGEGTARFARICFGLSLPFFGLSHFLYAEFTASMIPEWFPARLFFAYATGVGHVAAGLAILFNLWPRLGATLEALMMCCFVLIVHLAGIIGAPSDRSQWTMICVASVLAGAAWVVAGSLRTQPSHT
jgi:uncharacterized membrane protein